MQNELLFNDIYMTKNYIEKNNLFPVHKNIVVIGEKNENLFMNELFSYINETTKYKYHFTSFDRSSHIDKFDDAVYILFFDVNTEININLIKQTLETIPKSKTNKFILITKLSPIPYIKQTRAISEMELSVIQESTILANIEELLHEYSETFNVYEIRVDNLYGASIIDDKRTNITSICENINKNKTIEITADDSLREFTATYICDLYTSIFTILKNGNNANVYNVCSFTFTEAEIKNELFDLTSSYGVNLILNNDKHELLEKYYSNISRGKLNSIGFKTVTDRKHTLRYTFSSKLNSQFDLQSDYINFQYDGKLEEIKQIELKALKEVDTICRENNIKYFLSGGSMLGAVRHKGFIPWDDDVDVAMLREDFEKFKMIAKNNLSEEFVYQTYENNDGYHFFFDKITNKYTYFATKYSDEFEMLKGISLDIFVFDKTSDSSFFQKLHYKRLMALRKILNVRWKNRARKGKMYILSLVLLPLLRLFSLDKLAKHYDKATRAYENKNTSFVLPPATDEKYVGSMPINWFTQVRKATFENIDTFIPVGYDEYLKLWYGSNYMQLLPLCERESSHDFYRLDLGASINKNTKLNLDGNGELL